MPPRQLAGATVASRSVLTCSAEHCFSKPWMAEMDSMRGVAGLMLSNLILVLGVVRATTELQQSAGQFAVFHMPRCCRYSFQAMLLAMTLLRCRCCMSVLLRSTPQQLLLFLCSNLQSPLSRHMVHHLYYLNVMSGWKGASRDGRLRTQAVNHVCLNLRMNVPPCFRRPDVFAVL